MPYKIVSVPKKKLYYVVNKVSGKKYSKNPISKTKAIGQMKALYVNEKI
jgi:hypothetical protein